ncbi:MAG: hypothetical protein K5639_00430 [Eubacterium sp.]|nr:hypothetical protein [Eubacterium sp.]
MFYFYFGNTEAKKKSKESTIDMLICPKGKYADPKSFFEGAIACLDEKIYNGRKTEIDFEKAEIEEGEYMDTVNKWVEHTNKKMAIKIDNIRKTYHIKHKVYNPLRDEFILETDDEYVLFLWSIPA